MTEDFSFIHDSQIRQILVRDYTELQQLNTRTATKSVIVLSGGIIESLLFDALVGCRQWTVEQACQKPLADMIVAAKNKEIITEDRLTNATRKYRNLIHPGREIKYRMVFEEADAVSNKSAVDIIIREVRSWWDFERRRQALRDFLMQLDSNQKAVLQLFAHPNPSSGGFDHPFLDHRVYASIRSLVGNGVLERNNVNQSQERVRIVPDTITLIEELVTTGKIQRDSILLDYNNIAASGAGGSGAPPNSR